MTQAKPNFEDVKSIPSSLRIRLKDMKIDDHAGKDKLMASLIKHNICRQLEDHDLSDEEEVAEHQDIREANLKAKERTW